MFELDITKEFRERSRGKYYNDFSFLKEGSTFPNLEMLDRNAIYRMRYSQLIGEDAKKVNLVYQLAGEEFEIPMTPIGENFYKLTTNKLLDLMFNNEWIIRTGNLKTDKQLSKLIERTGVKNSIRRGIGDVTTYGDVGFKVHKNGVSNILPVYVFKVVDPSDYNKVLGTCLYDVIKNIDHVTGTERITHVRFEIHKDGWVFDIVYKCESAYPYIKIGNSVDYIFRYGDTERVIPKGGKWYKTGVNDCSLLQIASINKNCDGAYGQSIYVDFQDNVYALQQRLTIENATLNNLTQPLLIIGSSMTDVDEKTGSIKLKVTNGKYLVFNDMSNATPPHAFQQDYKLDNSEKLVDRLSGLIYIMSELGKPFMCGEYGGGNLSTESMNNLIKPALDKGERIATETYYEIRDVIYALAVLNGINIKKEDLTIILNIGRTEDDEKVCNIINKLIPNKQVVSTQYVLEKYMGLDSEQAEEMFKQIEVENKQVDKESGSVSEDAEPFAVLKDQKQKDIEEDKTNETNGLS